MTTNPVEIRYPKMKGGMYKIKRWPVFCAAGLTSEDRKVKGFLFDKNNMQVSEGIPIRHSVVKWPKSTSNPPVYRWLIMFIYDDLKLESYKLRVEWAGDSTKYDERTFTVAAFSEDEEKQSYQIGITSHAGDEDITAEANSFTASGDLQQGHTLAVAKMNAIGASFMQSDTSRQTWIAQWAPLPVGTYTLYVEDNAGQTHNAQVTGLTVNENP